MGKRVGVVRLLVVAGLLVTACGTDTSDETTSSVAQPTSTVGQVATTTTAPVVTTTSADTTTTTTAPVSGEAIHELFASYFDALVAKDWQSARDLATGPAADYATFVELLDKVSTQPNWESETITEPDCCEVVDVADGKHGTEAAIGYVAPDGSSSLAVDNPVVATEDGELRLEYWGEDLKNDREAPSLTQRIKSVSFADKYDPTVCTSDGQWAYVPGGTEPSIETTIILMGSLCDSTSDLVGDPSLMTIFTADGSVDIAADTVLWEGGPEAIPTGETRLFLAIYTVPSEVASQELFGGVRFQQDSGTRFQFTIEIGAFELVG